MLPNAWVAWQANRTVQRAVNFLRSTIPASVQVVENLQPVAGAVVADRTQIHAALLNLVSNAVDAMDGGIGTLRVSLGARPSTEVAGQGAAIDGQIYAVIEVADTGTGMDEKTVARMFDPFFTTKPTGKGTGLGLSIVHGIVSKHGGFVQMQSTPGQGTTVAIWLPLADGEAS
ncbi:MAG: hypothetical protein HQL42_16745 [Alphaproteobacteria bacterium]|nr:hypothetical protein [Alphaproteobacteria bacterium]